MIARLQAALRREDGIALVMALMVMTVLTIGAGSAIYYAQASGGESRFSKAQESAYHGAEAGLADAIAVVKNPNNNAGDSTLFGSPQATTTVCIDPARSAVSNVCPSGQLTWATFTGVLNSDPAGDGSVSPRWELTATGYAENPTGGNAAPLKRTVGAYVTLAAPPGWTSSSDDSWSYLFSTQARSVSGACDQTYTTNISTYVYVNGNLCLSGANGMILDPSNNDKVEANGSITLASTTNYLGQSTDAIGTLKTNLGCKYNGGALVHPCTNGSNHQYFKNTSASNGTTDNLTPPNVDWDGWYLQASPGPHANCEAEGSKSTSHTTWPTFDNNTVRDNSVSTVVDLTPAYAYTCWTQNGEIAWDPSTKTMLIYGTVFIDGSAKMANGALNIYKGWGTIYLSGTFYMSSGTKMCAWTTSGGTCSNGFWSLFAFFVVATNGVGPNQGGLVPAGDGTKLAGSIFQGWLYSTNNIEADATATLMGPAIANQLILGSNVTKWNSFGNTGPSGAPGNPPANSTTQDPSNFTG